MKILSTERDTTTDGLWIAHTDEGRFTGWAGSSNTYSRLIAALCERDAERERERGRTEATNENEGGKP